MIEPKEALNCSKLPLRVPAVTMTNQLDVFVCGLDCLAGKHFLPEWQRSGPLGLQGSDHGPWGPWGC